MGCREYRRICGKRRVWAPVLVFGLFVYNIHYHPFAAQVGASNPSIVPPPVHTEAAPRSTGLDAQADTLTQPPPPAMVSPTQLPPPPAVAPDPAVPVPSAAAGVSAPAPLTQERMDGMSEEEKRTYAASINTAQQIFNSEKLPSPLGAAPIIVVMVHNRPKYFAAVLQSLENVRGIENALLVVSLDFLSPEMDALVRGVKFCAVVQIFCSASQQLFPAAFPGTDPKDCAGGWDSLKKPAAKASGCINWETPDQYGHYREAKFVAVKHHWFWQFNFLFQKLKVAAAVSVCNRPTKAHVLEVGKPPKTRNVRRMEIRAGSRNRPCMRVCMQGQWSGYALYLEEDNYVAPDILNVLASLHALHARARARVTLPFPTLKARDKAFLADIFSPVLQGQMGEVAKSQCGEEKCGLLNLGLKVKEAVSDNGAGFESRGHQLHVAGWESPKHNVKGAQISPFHLLLRPPFFLVPSSFDRFVPCSLSRLLSVCLSAVAV